jgi:hypothetical protein
MKGRIGQPGGQSKLNPINLLDMELNENMRHWRDDGNILMVTDDLNEAWEGQLRTNKSNNPMKNEEVSENMKFWVRVWESESPFRYLKSECDVSFYWNGSDRRKFAIFTQIRLAILANLRDHIHNRIPSSLFLIPGRIQKHTSISTCSL